MISSTAMLDEAARYEGIARQCLETGDTNTAEQMFQRRNYLLRQACIRDDLERKQEHIKVLSELLTDLGHSCVLYDNGLGLIVTPKDYKSATIETEMNFRDGSIYFVSTGRIPGVPMKVYGHGTWSHLFEI